ncbi:MAG: LemA family protein [Rhodocyclaceae bacterium]|nr:LemA family protein [Rhodocyclaceae bacterium]
MTISLLILLGLVAAALSYGVTLYNGLVQRKHDVTKAWANIDVLLKQRHDELPKLVETCRQYQRFEQETLSRVIEARNRVHDANEKGDLAALGKAEGQLRGGLDRLFALAESYPELKTNASYIQLQGRISVLENAIADRRELYNETVNIHNARLEQFPDVLLARRYGFAPKPILEFAEGEKTDVDLKVLFKD